MYFPRVSAGGIELLDQSFEEVQSFSEVSAQIHYIETLGTTYNGGLANPDLLLTSGMWSDYTGPGFHTKLNRVYRNGEVIWQTADLFDFKTAGINEIHDDSASLNSESVMTFNLMGLPVYTPQPGSVYIRNGKKFVCPAY